MGSLYEEVLALRDNSGLLAGTRRYILYSRYLAVRQRDHRPKFDDDSMVIRYKTSRRGFVDRLRSYPGNLVGLRQKRELMDSSTIVLAIIAASGGIFSFALGVITVTRESRLKERELKVRQDKEAREHEALKEKEDRELDLRVLEAGKAMLVPMTDRINVLEKRLGEITEQAGRCQETIRQLTGQLQDRDTEINKQKEEILKLRNEVDKLTKQVNGKPKTKPI